MVDQTMHKFLSKQETKHIQSIAGSFLYCVRVLDSTILTALKDIGTTQEKSTEHIREECEQILDCVTTRPNTLIRHYASDMMLHIDSDAAFLVLTDAKSRMAGFFLYLVTFIRHR